MIENTPAQRRVAIRNAVKDKIEEAVAFLPHGAVFASRAEVEGLEDFISIYFDEVDRERSHSTADAGVDLVIRISSKIEPDKVDDHLDDIASYIETAMNDSSDLPKVWDCFHTGCAYSDSQSGIYSALELKYQLKYTD